ncbi:efflux transporter outer membrane subunit [Cytophagaceae bacterium YF14B1]|uniref:Efflux transporter outer membrane subunit n=1 Tax=Xanthocytophaga flava TaxID=3048013 RepID=A0AAE3QPZ7_9BACT|nr:efflux transporter outer membrane subunit [Xanthocytophaga flavus]MDJ1481090.1 efflux transporter outer membrane subunit [Xanthocytophaga flavus]
MKHRLSLYIYLLALVGLTLNSCKSLDTSVSVPKRNLPGTFTGQQDSASVASVNWRQYFADSALVSLIDTALTRNIDLQIALQRVEIFRSNIRFAKGAMLPQAGLAIAGGVRKFGLYTMDGAGNITTEITPGQIVPTHLPDLYVGLQTSWEIDIWGKLKNQRQSAVVQYLASVEGKNFVLTNLIADIAISYYELLSLDNELEITRQTIQKQKEAVEAVETLKDAARENQLAVHQFNAQLLNTQALEREILQQIVETENRINFLLGRFPQPAPRQKESLFRQSTQTLSAGIPSLLLLNRPDIREAELQLRASQLDLQSARKSFLPSFSITGGYGFQAFKPEFLFTMPASIAYSALGNLVTPLVNRNALKAQFTTAKAIQVQAMYVYQQAILNGYTEVVNELSNINNLKEILIFKQQQADALLQSVETSTELYKSGRASYLDVLIAQQNSLQAQLDVIATNKRQRIASVNVYRALGGGWK